MKEKAVLAFSGGLDTSYCIKYLTYEKNLEVHSVFANTGSFSEQDVAELKEQAEQLGVASHTNLDITEDYYNNAIRYLIYGNVLRNHTYPLSVSSERAFQAKAVAECAKKWGAHYLAHGSTGAGNDQVRFDLIFQTIAPDIQIIAPIRDQKVSREEEIQYLKKHGYSSHWEQNPYSINKGLWGTSIGGKETLTSNQPLPEEAYPGKVKHNEDTQLTLEFKNGEPHKLNGEEYESPVDIIQELNKIGSEYAVGRGIHVGDTILGIKGRVGFEAPAPMIIINAHQTLEKHTLTKWQLYWKDQLAEWYGMLFHEGQYTAPVMRNIETFLADTQKRVTGKVFIRLKPNAIDIEGIEADHDLMRSDFADYGEMNQAWSGEDVKGFTKILSNYIKINNFA